MLINNIESDQASAEANNDHPLLQPLVIGGLTIENRLMVAPMAGVTDREPVMPIRPGAAEPRSLLTLCYFVDCANPLARVTR